jgi:predicted DCC family thiol-disulfide oxidoreductase YuxK
MEANPETAHPALPADTPVLFYDGICGFCNKAVQFIVRHDRPGRYRFITLQSALAAEMLGPYGVDTTKLDSAILLYKSRIYTQSEMGLMNGRLLGGIWRVLAWPGYLVPRFVRDSIYRWIARNRYKWFGTVDACDLPTPALRARFLA